MPAPSLHRKPTDSLIIQLHLCIYDCGIVGCGTGNFVVALSPYVGQVHGLDYSKGMVAKAKEKTQHLTNVELQEGDITSIPFLDDYFDGIIINQVHLSIGDYSVKNADVCRL